MSISGLINDINAAAAGSSGNVSEEERKQLLQACEKLQESLENPFEKTMRILLSGHRAGAIRLAIDMGLFNATVKKSGEGDGISIEQIAEEIGAEPLLVARIIRLLSSMGVLKQSSKDTFTSTPLALAYVSSSPLSAAVIQVTHFFKTLWQMPDYFAQTGWKNPSDGYDGPFQFSHRTKQHYFEWVAEHPYYQKAFNATMQLSFRRNGEDWFTFFPVAEKLSVQDPADALLVDIGGSQGKDLAALKKLYPDLPGRLILQDLPAVVEAARDRLPHGIEVQGHDFFDPQPVEGAAAYYLRTVLHDWPDMQALRILARVREAMGPESLLLIDEICLPETHVPFRAAVGDFMMMAGFSGAERTENQFRKLLEEAGFELVKAWMPEGAVGGQSTLFEARLRQ